MKIYNRKSITDKLSKYCTFAKENDFIEVTEGENISLTECYNAIVTYYNTNKEFVSGESIGNNPNGKTLTITENGYIKVSLRYLNVSGVANFDYTCFAVCKGNSAIYEPFGSKIKLKDEYVANGQQEKDLIAFKNNTTFILNDEIISDSLLSADDEEIQL